MQTSKTKLDNKKTVYFVAIVILSILSSLLVFFFEKVVGKSDRSFGEETTSLIAFFSGCPKLLIWLFMAFIQIVFCISIIPVLFNQIKDLHSKFIFHSRDITITIILLVLFV